MLHLILQAGPFLWPIVLCSVVGFAIFLERARVLLRLRRTLPKLSGEIVQLARGGRMQEAAALCERHDGPVTNVVGALIASLDLDPAKRDQVVTVAGNRELRQLERGLRGVAVIARIAPLLGLLGTVVGLVEAFIGVSTMQGPPDPSVLASGIWQALLTTVAGLLVAIPAIVSHEWLQSRVDEIGLRMQEVVTEVLAAADRPSEDDGDD